MNGTATDYYFITLTMKGPHVALQFTRCDLMVVGANGVGPTLRRSLLFTILFNMELSKAVL
jgi:hypothetical protein